jgi:hypothetical protein
MLADTSIAGLAKAGELLQVQREALNLLFRDRIAALRRESRRAIALPYRDPDPALVSLVVRDDYRGCR